MSTAEHLSPQRWPNLIPICTHWKIMILDKVLTTATHTNNHPGCYRPALSTHTYNSAKNDKVCNTGECDGDIQYSVVHANQ